MTGCNRKLLATALGLVLAAPAMAQVSVGVAGQAAGRAQVPTPQLPAVPTTPPAPTLPAEAAGQAVQATAAAQQANAARTEATTAQQAAQEARRQAGVAAQGAANASANAAVAQRDLWMRLDADHDGRISPTEADADSSFGLKFDDLDMDDDGFVSQAEYDASAKAGVSQGAEHAAAHSAVVTRETFMRLDTDRDGRVSSTEADADAGFDGSFGAMDGNSDGFVTEAEFRAHAKATAQPGGEATPRRGR